VQAELTKKEHVDTGVDIVKEMADIYYGWHAYPACALYNGIGGPDQHTASVLAPFRIAVGDSCPDGTLRCEGIAIANNGAQGCRVTMSKHLFGAASAAEKCNPPIGCMSGN
jgi:hypothetical protein